MKKAMLFIAVAVSALSLNGQTVFVPNGTSGIGTSSNDSVGIGVSTPQAALDINGGVIVRGWDAVLNARNNSGQVFPLIGTYQGWNDKAIFIAGYNASNTTEFSTKYVSIGGAGVERLWVNLASGNVGLGTTDPQYKLDVDGDLRTKNRLFVGKNLQINDEDNHVIISCLGSDNRFVFFGNNQWQEITCGNFNSTGNSLIDGSLNVRGNLGIGTTAPDQKLTVKGKIHAEEVIVDLNVPLADYVFGKDYELMPLHQVDQYVQENSRLPDMPSATEVKEKGMGVGEMQNKMLQKIEELTLYVIQQDKRIKALEEENQRLKK